MHRDIADILPTVRHNVPQANHPYVICCNKLWRDHLHGPAVRTFAICDLRRFPKEAPGGPSHEYIGLNFQEEMDEKHLIVKKERDFLKAWSHFQPMSTGSSEAYSSSSLRLGSATDTG
jgi:hypothetical protein